MRRKKAFLKLIFIVESILLTLANWLNLISFIEAVWWHFTDPQTSGLSYPGAAVLIVSIFFPPILLSFKVIRRFKPRSLTLIIIKSLPSVLLCMSSIPIFHIYPWVRTGLLGAGVFLLPFEIAWVLTNFIYAYSKNASNKSKECLQNEKCVDQTGAKQFHTTESLMLICIEDFSNRIFLFTVLLNMSIRYCTGTINVFYENWKFSLALMILVLIFSFTHFVVKRKKIPIQSNYYMSEEKTDPNIQSNCISSNRCSTIVRSCCNTNTTYIDSVVFSDISLNKDHSVSETVQLIEALPTELQILIGVFSCIQGYAFGLLLVLFLWVFSNPVLLVRWAALTHYDGGVFVLLIFGLATITSLFLSRNFHWLLNVYKVSAKKSKIAYGFLVSLTIIMFIFLIAGIIMLLYTETISAIVGGLFLCFFLPLYFSINCASINWLISLTNNGVVGEFVPGLVSSFAGIGFLVTHLIFIMFINPQITSAFLGKIGIIWAYILVILFLSVLSFVFMFIILLKFSKFNPKNTLQNILSVNLCSCRNFFQKIIDNLHIVFLCFMVFFTFITAISVGPRFINDHCLSFHDQAIDNVMALTSFPESSQPSSFSVISWNILLGHDGYGRDNLPCIGKILNIINPDIVGLQESEALAPYWGGKDILEYLSGYLNRKFYPGAQPLEATLGTGIITGLKVIDYQSYILPSDEHNRLPRYSLVKIDCFVHNQLLRVLNIHAVFKNWTATGYKPSPFAETSRRQIQFLLSKAGNLSENIPTILMGDFNLNPDESELDILFDAGFNKTLLNDRILKSPSSITNRFAVVDHIFYRGLNVKFSQLLTETRNISDHYPLVAIFEIP